MNRKLARGLVAVIVVGAAVAFAAPYAVRRFAEGKVDAALRRIGYQTTSMVERGDVSVDVWSWTVKARNVAIIGAGGVSGVRIGTLTIAKPNDGRGEMTADRMVLDDVAITAPGERISIPRVEIQSYTGPKRGLTATPGLGREKATQADLFEQLSIERLTAPVVVFSGDAVPLKRTVRNLVVNNLEGGVVEAATADAITLEGPYLPPDAAGPASLLISTGAVTYRGFSLPALWRFYDGDPDVGSQPLARSVDVAKITASFALRPGGRLTAAIDRLRIDDLKFKPLGFPLSAFDPIATQVKFGKDATPQQVRQQISFGVDLATALSFDRISVTNAKFESLSGGEPQATASFGLAEIGPYSQARIEGAKVENAAFERADGLKGKLTSGKAFGFNATGLIDYAGRVARDEILLTTKPTAEDIIRIAPRLNAVEAEGFEASIADGEVKADRARIEIDAPLDSVPQRVTFKLAGLFAAPSANTRVQEWVKTLELDRLKGSAKFSLTLDPSDKTLSLDWLDYSFEQLGTLSASGKLEAVDPLLAASTGADFVDKFSAIKLAPFKFTLNDDGVADVLLRRAAERADRTPDAYRGEIAKATSETMVRLLGPPAEGSAKAISDFIEEPRSIEVTLSPRKRGQTLLDLMQAYDLGLVGLAQVVDVQALYRR